MPLFRPGIDNNTQYPRPANGKATSEEQDALEQMERAAELSAAEPVIESIQSNVHDAREDIAKIIDTPSNATAKEPSLALLEANRYSLQETIKKLAYDLTVPENSGKTEWDLRAQKEEAEQELLKVEQQIAELTK